VSLDAVPAACGASSLDLTRAHSYLSVTGLRLGNSIVPNGVVSINANFVNYPSEAGAPSDNQIYRFTNVRKNVHLSGIPNELLAIPTR
jgi:hypothetical protein